MNPTVFLDRVDAYPKASAAVAALLSQADFCLRPGDNVLVKPNLVAGKNAFLSCTHPAVVAGVCSYLKNFDVRIIVGDSPAFGSARAVADTAGLTTPLSKMGIRVETLKSGIPTKLNGGTVTLSRTALEADMILNVPKLKAHSQMRITAGVKNLFGCVTGVRKALLHAIHGDKENRFLSLIVDIMHALPSQVTVMDGISAMHVTGPIYGEEYKLGVLACSTDTVAVDSAVYTLLGLSSREVPLWQECRSRKLTGAIPECLNYPLLSPESISLPAPFQVPATLKPQSFSPPQILRSLFRRVLSKR